MRQLPKKKANVQRVSFSRNTVGARHWQCKFGYIGLRGRGIGE